MHLERDISIYGSGELPSKNFGEFTQEADLTSRVYLLSLACA